MRCDVKNNPVKSLRAAAQRRALARQCALAHRRALARAGRLTLALLLLAVVSCSRGRVIHPTGEAEERARAAQAEGVFAAPINKRPLPDLAAEASLPRALQYAFSASGDLEASYRQWRASLERVPQAGALADPKLDFTFMFDAANLTNFTGALNSIRLMAEQDLPARGKREARAGQALAEARAAGQRLRAARFALQKKVVQAYADLALNRAMQGQTSDTLRLLRESHEVALHRYHEGGDAVLADLRKLEVEIQTADSEQRQLRLQEASLAAALNGALNRPAALPVGKVDLPAVKRPQLTDEALLERAARSNPSLGELRRMIESQGAAQTLAALERRPDYTLGGGLETLLTPAVTAAVTLPINRERIRAGIAEALANRQAAEARLRAGEADVQARLIMALTTWRDAERVLDDYQTRILPKTRELLDTQMTTYGAGGGEILNVLDTERMLVDFRKLILRAESDRVRASADLEDIVGEDLFQYLPAAQTVDMASS